MPRPKRTFGTTNKLPSGRYRARYVGPDGERHSAPHTFDTKGDADTWLTLRRAEVLKDEWTPATDTGLTFGRYASIWLADRDLKPRTRELYGNIAARHLARFDPVPLRQITPTMVARWHADLKTGPTAKAHAYSLLRTILNTAVTYDLVAANPCRVRGAGSSKRVHKVTPATLPEIAVLVSEMPAQYRVMVILASWCGLRYGELAALRRKDIDKAAATIHVRRGVVRVRGQMLEGSPKTAAGTRDVSIPPHLAPAVLDHLARHCAPGRDGLLFPSATGGHLPTVTLYKFFYRARTAAGRPDLRWHDLRHTGAVLAASTGATLAELMARLGHSTPAAALRYQHAAQGRDAVIAGRLSDLVRAE